jgi:hypothetical protein
MKLAGTRRMTALLALATLMATPTSSYAKDAYFDVSVNDVTVTSGKLPAADALPTLGWQQWEALHPRIVLDSEGEALLAAATLTYWQWPADLRQNGRIVARIPAGLDVKGRLFLPLMDGKGMEALTFVIPKEKASAEAKTAFLKAQEAHYAGLVSRRIAGAAWFRHLLGQVQTELTGKPLAELPPPDPSISFSSGSNELEETYDLFTGGKALAENLQLDRLIRSDLQGEKTVELSSIEGIVVDPIDWTSLLPAEKPAADALAAYIPADQHAIFFPTFSALTELTDEMDQFGTPALSWLEPRSEDAGTKQKYQDQLCLSMSGLARLLGPSIVASVTMTGSDPFLRMGSDVAVLFKAKNAGVLKLHLTQKQEAAAAADPSAARKSGTVEGLAYAGLCNPQRSICSYLAESGDVFIVTNSLGQLARIAKVIGKTEPALDSLPEYTYFRARYKLGDPAESALLILSDATIRRWCSPRWRIVDSRRTRAAALMAELQAANLMSLSEGTASGQELKLPAGWPSLGNLSLARSGLVSDVYGTLAFMTPILEISADKVTQAEAEAYRWFADRYQRSWREFFDPIAVRVFASKDRISLDVTVMPLIATSEYRELIAASTGVSMEPVDGDPHQETLFRFGMSLNAESEPMKKLSGWSVTLVPGLSANPLAWFGRYVELFGDKDPFWQDLAAAPDAEKFFEKNFPRLPIALYVDVANGLKLAAFLTAVRAFIEQTAPGLTLWENITYRNQQYVKVSPTQAAREQSQDMPQELALYYAVSPERLIITLSERLLKESLKRQSAQKEGGKKKPAPVGAWLGKNANLQADGAVLPILERLAREEYAEEMQMHAWNNIPILNEWKRLFPGKEPVAVHRELWGTTLVCPGGGRYVWNEQWRTMESTLYGHPAQPKAGPGLLRPPLSELAFGNFGLTFENKGVTVSLALERNAKRFQSFLRNVFQMFCRHSRIRQCAWAFVAEAVIARAWYDVENTLFL